MTVTAMGALHIAEQIRGEPYDSWRTWDIERRATEIAILKLRMRLGL